MHPPHSLANIVGRGDIMTFLHLRGALIASTLFLSACGDLFNAGFEGDTPGLPPASSPQGSPVGDSITTGPSESFFVTSSQGIVGEKSYAFVEPIPALGSRSARTVMRSAPVGDMTKPVYVTWRGKFGTGGGLNTIVGYMGKPYVSLEFMDGDIYVEGEVVGSYVPGDNHTVVVSLFPESETFQVAITGDASFVRNVVEGPARAKGKVPENQVITDFVITRSENPRLVYVLDDARMSHDAPS